MLKWMTICLATFVLSGCVTTQGYQGPVAPDSSCTAFKVLHPSKADTTETKRQVLVHNSIYRRICTS